jgi:2-amino-4-hydroxy-6-hydroxymethyldihydropteridine diphosphokinase
MPDILLAFGGNLGDPVAAILDSIRALATTGVRVTRLSRFYRTPPWGVTDQPDFVNACARGDTDLEPEALLAAIQAVEVGLGRQQTVRWGPRPIDIDILAYDDASMATPDLTIPHPRLTERAFVLLPLSDVAPDWVIAGRPVRDWATAADCSGITELPPPPPSDAEPA